MAHEGIQQKAETAGRTYEDQLEYERDGIPSREITDPEEVANMVAYLLTDASPNVVGESFKVSGGTVLR